MFVTFKKIFFKKYFMKKKIIKYIFFKKLFLIKQTEPKYKTLALRRYLFIYISYWCKISIINFFLESFNKEVASQDVWFAGNSLELVEF